MTKSINRVKASETGDILYVPDLYLGHKLSSNTKTHFFRKYSGENYFTDQYGWRVGSNDDKTNLKKIDCFICGASTVLGTGVEFKDTIGNLISKKSNKIIANLGVGNYNDIQILRQIDISSKKKKPKFILMIYEDYIGRSFKPSGLMDIGHRPFFKKNKKTNKLELFEPNSVPFFLYKRFVDLKKKSRVKKLNFFNIIEEKILLLCFQFLNNRVKNFFLRLLGLNHYEYVSSEDIEARNFILKFISNKICKLVEKNNYNFFIYPIYPYMYEKKRIKRFYNEVDLLSKMIKKKHGSNKIFIDKSKSLEKAHKLFFKRNNIKKNFVGTLQWADNNHPTPAGTKIIADCIYKSLIKFKLI